MNMPDRSRVMPVAGILAPVCAVIAARVLFSAGPSVAPAAEPAVPTQLNLTPTPPASVALTTEQTAALRYVTQTPPAREVDSPMARPQEPEVEPVRPVQVEPDRPAYDPTQDLELSSVVGAGERAFASINGRIFRLGEQVLEEWTLTSVDVRNRTATLTHADGQVRVLHHNRND